MLVACVLGQPVRVRRRTRSKSSLCMITEASYQNHISDEEDKDAKARRVVRTNNFTQQTNVLDVDKHMMAYIEENMRLRKGAQDEGEEDGGPADPYAELFKITDRYKLNKEKEQEEGSVTNSMAMLTAIPEVDLGMEYV